MNNMNRRILINTLVNQVSFINLKYQEAIVNPFYYRMVAEAIQNGRISIREPLQNSGYGIGAKYFRDSNVIVYSLRSANQLQQIDSLALFVHEASHAISDLRRIKIRRSAEEAVAIVAQLMFMERNGSRVKPSSPLIATRRVSYQARYIAKTYLRGKKVPMRTWWDLEQLINRHPAYKGSINKTLVFDGI